MAKKTLREKLLAAPRRDWQTASTYQALYVVPTRKKHDSGYMLMAIVGCLPDKKFEVAATCDDICWHVKEDRKEYSLRCDCEYPSGILHFWGATFTVGSSLSSTDVTVTERERKVVAKALVP